MCPSLYQAYRLGVSVFVRGTLDTWPICLVMGLWPYSNLLRSFRVNTSSSVCFSGGSKDIKDFCDIEKFGEDTGASSVMIARAAEWNPSVLRKEGKLDLFQVIRRYLKYVRSTFLPFESKVFP